MVIDNENMKTDLCRIYTNPRNLFLRVALWEEYGYRDVYYGDLIAFRELEVDHIIPQYLYEPQNREKLMVILKEYNLPSDFQKNDLLNFTPTCRKPNASKGEDLIPAMTCRALKAARDKKASIIRRIERYINTKEVANSAILLKSKLKLEEDVYNAIDILLDDVYDFTHVEGNEFPSDKFLVLSKSKVCLRGKLPTVEELLPGCTIEFRTLLVRGMTMIMDGKEILKVLCVGNYTKPEEGYRPYLLFDPKDESYYIRLSRGIFKLSIADTIELCEHIDYYCEQYIEKLREINEKFDLNRFSLTYDNTGIRILKLKKSILTDIKIFISSHSIYNDCALEMGMHGTIYGRSLDGKIRFQLYLENAEQFFWNSEEEFWLVLTMDYAMKKDKYSQQEYWTPTKVREFIYELTKDALSSSEERYLAEQCVLKRVSEKKRVDEIVKNRLKEISYDIKMSKQQICVSDIKSIEDLYERISMLQEHFSIEAIGKDVCIDVNVGLYKGLMLLMQQYNLEKYALEYISKHLDCCEITCDSMKIAEGIGKMILERNKYSYREIEKVLCCYMKCIRSKGGSMNYQGVTEIVEMLKCVIDRYNRDILIEKYSN